jgi:hypothetical protein
LERRGPSKEADHGRRYQQADTTGKRAIGDRSPKRKPDALPYPLELFLAEVVPYQRLHTLDNAALRCHKPYVDAIDNRKHTEGDIAADLLEQVVRDDHD